MEPLLFSVPMEENASAPFMMIQATLAKVSTLLMLVGLPQRPLLAGKGGLNAASRVLPSTEAISAVSSPQTKAPGPFFYLDGEVHVRAEDVLRPDSPFARSCLMASFSRWTAFGYSART